MTTAQLIAVCPALLILIGIGYCAIYIPKNLTFIVNPDDLVVRGDMLYGRIIPRRELIATDASVVNDGRGKEIEFQMRTNGIGLPNYQSGWFRTNVGKALVFRRPGRSMVAIPVRSGYVLLISPGQPQEFLEKLQIPGSNFQAKIAG